VNVSNTSASTVLSVSASGKKNRTYTLTISATSGGLVQTATATLTVN
jgi:hypothetical protein